MFSNVLFSATTSYPIIFLISLQVRNLENFKCNAEVLAVYSRELSLFGIAGFSRTSNSRQ